MEMGQLGPCMQLYAVFRIKIARSASVIGPAAGSVSTASATWWPYFPTGRREAKIWCLAVKIEDSSPKIWKVEEFGRMRKHDLHWLIMGIWRFSFFHFFSQQTHCRVFQFLCFVGSRGHDKRQSYQQGAHLRDTAPSESFLSTKSWQDTNNTGYIDES